MEKAAVFRKRIEADGILLMPVVHDALCARIAERVGFEAIFVGGYANSASLLGMPDVNLLTMTETAETANRISDVVSIPVIVDADTGYGNVTNVMRTIKAMEKAGAAGIIIEDQMAPKRCGHMSGKEIIPAEEMQAKIRAAIGAQREEGMVIIARTDALSVSGLEEAIRRAKIYRETGADMTFVEAVETVEQMRAVIKGTRGPHMANMIPGGRSPSLSAKELQSIGYDLVAYPTLNTYAVARATMEVFQHLLNTGGWEGMENRLIEFDEFNRLIGLGEMREAERRYTTPNDH